jgi:hypothetical protein
MLNGPFLIDPERRTTDRTKWSYQDRDSSLLIIDIIFQLIAPDQRFWVRKDTQLPVIGDLNILQVPLIDLFTLPITSLLFAVAVVFRGAVEELDIVRRESSHHYMLTSLIISY